MKNRYIEDLWILTDDGITLFSSDDKIMDAQLFGGFLTAINLFVEELTNGYLKSFDTGTRRFYILKTPRLVFVASAPMIYRDEVVFEQLENVKDLFLELYPPEYFKTWNHNTSEFSSFGNMINDQSMMVV
jgi:hypothetical protein